jgi:hypothetical protein
MLVHPVEFFREAQVETGLLKKCFAIHFPGGASVSTLYKVQYQATALNHLQLLSV